MDLNRRESLALIAAFCGAAVLGAGRLAGLAFDANQNGPTRILTAPELALLNEIGETILPTTPGSPGAKAANVAEFMADRVANFFTENERTAFVAGLVDLQGHSRARFSGREFLVLTAPERYHLVLDLDQQRPQPEYYRMIKQLAIEGYFTSEIGATQAMVHVAVPGRFDGVVEIAPGTRAWSD